MSRYLICLTLIFLYLLVFEVLSWVLASTLISENIEFMHAEFSSQYGFIGLVLSQALIAYFFCFVMSRSDSTTIKHYVVFGMGVGTLLFIYKVVCMLVSQHLPMEYLWMTPFAILQFAGAAFIFAKYQLKQ